MRNLLNSLKALFKKSPAPMKAASPAAPAASPPAKTAPSASKETAKETGRKADKSNDGKAAPEKAASFTEAVVEVRADVAKPAEAEKTAMENGMGLWEQFARKLNTRVERDGPEFSCQVTGQYRDHSVQAGLYRVACADIPSAPRAARNTQERFALRLTTLQRGSVSWALRYGVAPRGEAGKPAPPDWYVDCEDKALGDQLNKVGLPALMQSRQPIKAAFGRDQEVHFEAGEGTLTFRVPLAFAFLAPSAQEFCEELDLLIDLADRSAQVGERQTVAV